MGECSVSMRTKSKPAPPMTSATNGSAMVMETPSASPPASMILFVRLSLTGFPSARSYACITYLSGNDGSRSGGPHAPARCLGGCYPLQEVGSMVGRAQCCAPGTPQGVPGACGARPPARRREINRMTGSGSDSSSAPGIDAGVIAALTELGFSQYEARTYAGLIGREPMTGYAIAKDTLVPQPKVYETLGRLVERGAVQRVSGSPAKFVAVPPARVLGELERTFRQRLATVELEVSRMRHDSADAHELRLYKETTSWITIVNTANDLISGASERIYVSGHGTYLEALGEEIAAADRRGVRIDILCFGEPPFSLHNGIVIRHSSTDGIIYRHHQS